MSAAVNDKLLVAMSQLAYCDDPPTVPGFDVATIDDQPTDTQSIVARDAHGNLIVAIRGSQQLRDWWYSMLFIRRYRLPQGARCHRKWWRAAQSVGRLLLGHAQDAKTIYLTGHSLGGAVAYLLALWMWQMGVTARVVVVTFGSPCPGNDECARQVLGSCAASRRYVQIGDSVAGLPLGSWWTPIGPAIEIGSHDLNPVNDHQMAGYVRAMQDVDQ